MKKRLFLYNTLIICAGLISLFFVLVYITHNNNINIAKNSVIEQAETFANLFDNITDIAAFTQTGSSTRITIISADGTVLADSYSETHENHENRLTRPEIQAAAQGSPAVHIRHSNTADTNMIYYALKVAHNGSYVYIRTAIPVAQIEAYLIQFLPMLLLTLAAIVAACLLLFRNAANRVINPYTSNVEQSLQNSFNALGNEKSRSAYILDNIGDGLFVADEYANITLINSAALDIFNVTPNITGKKLNYLSADKTLIAAAEDCVNNSHNSLFELTLNGKIYLVTTKRLPDTAQTMVVLSDVTENRESRQRREEFFANAGHELKTPLTAIVGFNELTALNNKDENLSKYINGITRESKRMMSLIGDMLKLSELENNNAAKPVTQPVSISLAKIINEVLETVSNTIEEKSIIIEQSGDAFVFAEPEHIYELVKNLIENAIRYNNQGGKVYVNITAERNTPRLTIADNGIGISPKEQTRIFERFYRVEKSRSAANGGTGLGLSIVKHICTLYNWNLALKSKLGIGTEVIIRFTNKRLFSG